MQHYSFNCVITCVVDPSLWSPISAFSAKIQQPAVILPCPVGTVSPTAMLNWDHKCDGVGESKARSPAESHPYIHKHAVCVLWLCQGCSSVFSSAMDHWRIAEWLEGE